MIMNVMKTDWQFEPTHHILLLATYVPTIEPSVEPTMNIPTPDPATSKLKKQNKNTLIIQQRSVGIIIIYFLPMSWNRK